MSTALGMIETNSIPRGIFAGDAMLKTAEVTLVMAQPVCPGKYVVGVCGLTAAVKAAVSAGQKAAGHALVDSLLIAGIHDSLPAALTGCTEIPVHCAVGILETFSLCSSVLAADRAAKTAEITLIEVRLGRGLGGKSYVLLGGDVAAVNAAIRAAGEEEGLAGLLGDSIVIPSPHPDILGAF
jgi:microcompartment protein CcmL/EutN